MRTAFQIATSALALAGLMAGAAAHATGLAELPLKMSVLAKPNVVFGMDDSGSMDWEVLLSTDSGLAYWNGSSSFGSNGKPLETASAKYAYLFPLGSTTGGALYAYSDANYGRAAPPSNQFAWLRSAKFNPLYYNSTTTYEPWAPATVSGTYYASFPAATATAAKSHPLVTNPPTLNLSTQWDSNNSNFSSNGYRFYMQGGMVVPSGSYIVSSRADGSGTPCSGSTARTLTADQTVPSGSACWASIPYYPATFWNAEACTVNGTDCITAPDGTTKLKRYEIKSTTASYPSGRSYADELQNFANWFTYDRKRKLMLAASMGRSLENITGLRMAVMPFSTSPTLTMYDSDSTANASNRYAIAGQFYNNAMSANGTPTHATVKRIGTQFNSNTGIVQYACQRNSMFVVTDGFANSHSETTPTYTKATFGTGAPYATTASNSLADFALAYYTNRLRTDLTAGRVPSGNPSRVNPDLNTNLHVTTYAITLGARGTLYPNAADPFATDVFASPPTWPTPVADDPTMIDDLWHATINGRGKMYLANDVEGTRVAIQNALQDILSQAGAQGGVAVSAVNLDRSDSQAYLGVYDPSGWSGDLTANPIDRITAAVNATPTWRAAPLLAARNWTQRIIFTSSGSAGIDFSSANIGAAVNPNSAVYGNDAVVDYLRGSRVGEGTTFRTRTALLGAVVNAEPVLARDERTVYLASGDGMLHAFDTLDGSEQWAYAPPDQLGKLGQSVQRGWIYQTMLDATPTYARLSSGSKLLVGGLGAAGRSYYALDVSAPRGLTAAQAAAQFRWIFPAAGDAANRALMGYTVGKPVIARTAADGDVVLVTSGYDNAQSIGDGKGRMWMLDATTGAVIKTFRTTAGAVGAEAGLAHIAAFREGDGTVRYVYGGDLLGNLWRFDLTTAGAGEHNGFLLATFKDASNNAQPVTAVPELVTVEGQRVVLVGTGRLLDVSDFGSTRRQSFYAIADGANLPNARAGLVAQTYTAATDTMTANPIDWATQRGWYFDLPAGQQANTDPVVAYGAVAFSTNVIGSTDCSESSYLYWLDIGTGTKIPGASFLSLPMSSTSTSSRLLIVRGIQGDIYSLGHLGNNAIDKRKGPFADTIKPAKNAWRELRR